MATVYSCGNSEGERRCDAKCHNATQPECDCVCGGYFHGASVNGSMQEKVQDLADAIAEKIRLGDTQSDIKEYLRRLGIMPEATLHPQQLELL